MCTVFFFIRRRGKPFSREKDFLLPSHPKMSFKIAGNGVGMKMPCARRKLGLADFFAIILIRLNWQAQTKKLKRKE